MQSENLAAMIHAQVRKYADRKKTPCTTRKVMSGRAFPGRSLASALMMRLKDFLSSDPRG